MNKCKGVEKVAAKAIERAWVFDMELQCVPAAVLKVEGMFLHFLHIEEWAV